MMFDLALFKAVGAATATVWVSEFSSSATQRVSRRFLEQPARLDLVHLAQGILGGLLLPRPIGRMWLTVNLVQAAYRTLTDFGLSGARASFGIDHVLGFRLDTGGPPLT